jgi:hypothetical protein
LGCARVSPSPHAPALANPKFTHFWNIPPRVESVFLDKPAQPAFQNNRVLDLKIVFAELTNIPSACTAQTEAACSV